MQKKPRVFCLMGPTAAGKTQLALTLAQNFPLEIVSVDSAMVYRGMNIGTGKPTTKILEAIPHHLIDICDPLEIYSAGKFCRDVVGIIEQIFCTNKIPLLVGGTMMYFRALQYGLASLPPANENIRQQLYLRASSEGWETLHAELAKIDAPAAKRIAKADGQRIQRALEVYLLTGKTMSQCQAVETIASPYDFYNVAMIPEREILHQNIASRFEEMLNQGFLSEVEQLFARGDLNAALPALRSVGYAQLWAYLAGEYDFKTAQEKAIIATRQLAKRQCTWLRAWPGLLTFQDEQALNKILGHFFLKT